MKNHNFVEPQFSYFKEPVKNVTPYKSITIADVYRALTSDYLKVRTQQLRLISEKTKNRLYKATYFPYVTFSGVFGPTRKNANLIEHSGLIALDFDNVGKVELLKEQLLEDRYFKTELLFISPNGNGIKWIVAIDINEKYSHGKWFQAIYEYVLDTYAIKADEACKDVSRPTYLCYDPDTYIREKHIIK